MKDDNFNLKDAGNVRCFLFNTQTTQCFVSFPITKASFAKHKFCEIRNLFHMKFSRILYERNSRVIPTPNPELTKNGPTTLKFSQNTVVSFTQSQQYNLKLRNR